MSESSKNYSKSANRALDVLNYFAVTKRSARACDIADAFGMARSSTDQLLKTMVAGGYLVLSSQDKTYFPSLRLAAFGRWISDCYPNAQQLHDILADVHDRTGAIVTITMQNDCFMQILECAHKDEDPNMGAALQVGAMVPVLNTAIGSAAIMSKTKDEIRKLLRRARYRHAGDGNQSSLHIKSLMENLRADQQRGYSSRVIRGKGLGRSETATLGDRHSSARSETEASLVLGLAGPTAPSQRDEWLIAKLMRSCIDRALVN